MAVIRLPVPHVTQLQDGLRNACGPAYGVSMIHALTSHRPTLRQAAMTTGNGLNEFTSFNGMIRMFGAFGLTARHTTQASLEWAKTMIGQGIAPCHLVDYPSLGSEIDYKFAHFIGAVGFDNRYMLLNDPLRDTGEWPCRLDDFVAAINTPSTWAKRDDNGRLITGKNAPRQALYIPEPRLPATPAEARQRMRDAVAAIRAAVDKVSEVIEGEK